MRQQLGLVRGTVAAETRCGKTEAGTEERQRAKTAAEAGVGWSWLRERRGRRGGKDSGKNETGLKEGREMEETEKTGKDRQNQGKDSQNAVWGKGSRQDRLT